MRLLPFFVLAAIPAPALVAEPARVSVTSTLKTAGDHIRQYVLDGDPSTYFASEGAPGKSDALTLTFDRPIALKSVEVLAGRPDGADKANAGAVEVSADGKTFEPFASFEAGKAHSDAKGQSALAIRIKPASGASGPLAIREVTIDSEPAVTPFKYPVEFTVDTSEAPEMKEWAEKAAAECEKWYPRLNEELKSDGYKPARQVTMRIDPNYKGVAEAGGSRIRGSVRWFKEHPGDVGAMIHETCHVIQHYRSRNNPGWLVEGVADYVRFFKYEPGKIGPINAERARYNAAYRVTAAFLAYVSEKYNKDLVLKLNAIMRDGKYKEEVFKELTGKTVQELDEEWRASLKK